MSDTRAEAIQSGGQAASDAPPPAGRPAAERDAQAVPPAPSDPADPPADPDDPLNPA
jgi:hypothetical protein